MQEVASHFLLPHTVSAHSWVTWSWRVQMKVSGRSCRTQSKHASAPMTTHSLVHVDLTLTWWVVIWFLIECQRHWGKSHRFLVHLFGSLWRICYIISTRLHSSFLCTTTPQASCLPSPQLQTWELGCSITKLHQDCTCSMIWSTCLFRIVGVIRHSCHWVSLMLQSKSRSAAWSSSLYNEANGNQSLLEMQHMRILSWYMQLLGKM